MVLPKQLVQPFLYDGFTVAARYGKHRQMVLPAVVRCQLLQGGNGVGNLQNCRFGELRGGLRLGLPQIAGCLCGTNPPKNDVHYAFYLLWQKTRFRWYVPQHDDCPTAAV